jgi:ketosteroid isomerase-like protein
MIERQARAWIEADFALAAPDWHPEGVLVAPGHLVAAADLGEEIERLHRDYRDLAITVVAAFESPGGWVGIEWLWDITRRADGAASRTHDAIIVERRDGLIVGWREYFDTHGSVEAHHD